MRRTPVPGLVVAGIAQVLGACGEPAPTLLAEMGPVVVSISDMTNKYLYPGGSGHDIQIELYSLASPTCTETCPVIDTGTTATIGDGTPVKIRYPGGESECDHNGFRQCDVVSFETDTRFPLADGDSATSTIVIEDSSATWTIEVEGLLLASDLRMIGTPTTNGQVLLEWPSATSGWRPAVSFQADSLEQIVTWGNTNWDGTLRWEQGSSSSLPMPGPTSGFLTVFGTSNPSKPIRCEGPASCSVVLVRRSPDYPATLF